MAIRWVILGDSRYCDSVETANTMLGCVIIVAYIRHPIISLYVVFSDGVRHVDDTTGELRLRSTLGVMGVMVVCASWSPKQAMICLIYAF